MKIELAYGRQGLLVELPADTEATIVRKPEIARPADPRSHRAGAGTTDWMRRAGVAGHGSPKRLYPDLRYHAARAQRPFSAPVDRTVDAGRRTGERDHRSGCYGPAPAQSRCGITGVAG